MRVLTAVLLASTMLFGAVKPQAFANTNAHGKVYVCATPQTIGIVQADFEALLWVEVKHVGSFGETGSNTNILTYDEWGTDVIQKAKGITDAGSPEIEVARTPTDAGQLIMRAAALTNLNYAIKTVKNDPVTVGGVGTVIYNLGLVTGPKRPQGRNEDFDIEVFTLGLQQREIVVNPTAGGVAPAFTVVPAITGTIEVGETINLSNGTVTGDATLVYTYQWFAGGVALAGETANTLLLTVAHQGKIVQGRVHVSNASGSASATSAATAAVGA